MGSTSGESPGEGISVEDLLLANQDDKTDTCTTSPCSSSGASGHDVSSKKLSASEVSSAVSDNTKLLDAGVLLYAVSTNNVAEVTTLLKQGVDPNAADYDKRTACHIAASEGHLHILKLLKEAGANFRIKDRWGGTCLDDAIEEKQNECENYLRGLEVPTGFRRQVTNVATASGVDSDDETRATDPNSALAKFLTAAAAGSVPQIKAYKGNVNESDYDHRTALHIACSEGHLEVATYLVKEKGALINFRDRWGHTPLDEALRVGSTDVIEFLREFGGEATGAYDEIMDSVSEHDFKRLQKRGSREKWAIQKSEIIISGKPFARGAGGELYKAKWRGLHCVVKSCMMVSNKQQLIDLGIEISLLSHLRHPNLVMFLGASFEASPPLLLMEFCSGGTLEERIVRCAAENRQLSKKERVKFTFELALGMNFLHLCNPCVVHRDLKPSNILLTGDLNVRITDFGLSKFIASKNKKMNDQFKMTGETGSYRYMAPEVFKHEQYNEKVDVYSFALIVYWIHTLVRPFVHYSDPVQAVRAASIEGARPGFPERMEPQLKKLLAACWEQDPDKRPSFADVLLSLEKIGYESVPFVKHHSKCSIS